MRPRLSAVTALTTAAFMLPLAAVPAVSASPLSSPALATASSAAVIEAGKSQTVTLKEAQAFYKKNVKTLLRTAEQRGKALRMTLATSFSDGTASAGEASMNPDGTLYIEVKRPDGTVMQMTCPTPQLCASRVTGEAWDQQTPADARIITTRYVTRDSLVTKLPQTGRYTIDGSSLAFSYVDKRYGRISGMFTFTRDSLTTTVRVLGPKQDTPAVTKSKTTLTAPTKVTVVPEL